VLRAELEAYPKRIRDAETKLGGARGDVAAAKEAHAQVVAERKKFEFDAQQWKDRASQVSRSERRRKNQPKPTKALQHEIANAEAEVAKADDRQLEVMMAAEEVERRVKIAESRLKEAEQAVAAERKEIQAQGTEKKKQLDAPSPSTKKSSLRFRKICACSTRASPFATMEPRWPKPRWPVPRLRHARSAAHHSGAAPGNQRRSLPLRKLRPDPLLP